MNAITPTTHKARLLIVDDELAHMTALYHTLEDSGYNVTAFGDAALAIESMRRQEFDLLLTDLKMPVMDGITLLRTAQKVDPHLVGIVMTGHGAIDTAIEAMKAGAQDYILKPFKLSTLLPVLTRALEVRQLRMEVAELQQRLRQHVIELEAANQELEAFSSSVSHDLRAPLRAIAGFSSLLVENYCTQLPADARQLLDRVQLSVKRMDLLIEHMLRFARLSRQQLTRGPVDIKALVNEVLEELRNDHKDRQTDIRVGLLPDAVGDTILLRQVFINLLSNAFKFTRQKARAVIEIGCEPIDGKLVYFVRDNGAGFDMRYAERLFSAFYRLHDPSTFEGVGIGLSLVQRVVQRHGGRIWVKAAVDQGATFYFTLPD
jgi:signal transduction histidine kinase